MNTQLMVQLASAPNPDYMYDAKGVIEQLLKTTPSPLYVPCECLEQASAICTAFIQINDLGAGNWTGGRVVNENFEYVALVSYNGRVWSTVAGNPCGYTLDIPLLQSYLNQLL